MKTLKLLILISFLSSCVHNNKDASERISIETTNTKDFHSKPKQESKHLFDLGDFVIITDADEEDFNIITKNDTIFIQKVLYKTLDEAILKPKESVKLELLNEELTIGFKQYTIDDNPATNLDINLKKIITSKVSKPYRFLSSEDLSHWLFSQHFNTIKTQSLKFQNTFYQQLLKDKNKYTECCPEYIKQAEVFLKSHKDSFKDFDKLNVFPEIKKRVIAIDYQKNNQVYRIVILYNEINN